MDNGEQRDYSVTLSIDAYGTPESVTEEFRQYVKDYADYELQVREYRARDWGFEIDPNYVRGYSPEPVVIGDKVRWYTNPRLTGTVILVGPSRQGSPVARPMVAVQWDGLSDDDLAELQATGVPTDHALGRVTVEDRELLKITERFVRRRWGCYECKTANVGFVSEDAVCPNCGSTYEEAGIPHPLDQK